VPTKSSYFRAPSEATRDPGTAGDLSAADSEGARSILRVEAARMVQQPLNPAVLEAARQMLDRHDLRASEALQLGSALVAREMFAGLEVIFVSAQPRLRQAAAAERFETLDPVHELVAG